MNWHSPAEFFAMGGHALYVWGSFGACLALFIVEPLLLARRRQAVEALLRRHARADRLAPEPP